MFSFTGLWAKMNRKNDRPGTVQGAFDAIPIFLGYYTTSIAFGLLAINSGLSSFQAVLFSMTNLTGAAQFLAINLISAGSAMGEIVTSVAMLNMRYFMMSASLAKKLGLHSIFSKILVPAAVTDEVFSVISFREGKTGTDYIFGLQSVSWLGWVTGTITGVTAGNLLPKTLQQAVAIALFALFVALLVPEVKRSTLALVLALSSGALNSFLHYVFHIPPGWSIVISMTATAGIGGFFIHRMIPVKAGRRQE